MTGTLFSIIILGRSFFTVKTTEGNIFMKFLVIRHGDPDYAVDGLTERGKQEAEALAPYLESLEVRHIYSSSMGRAVATAQPTAARLHLPVIQFDWAREISGRYEPVPGERRAAFNIPGSDLRSIAPEPPYPIDYARFSLYEEEQIEARIQGLKEGINALFAEYGYIREGSRYRLENPSGDVVALFCHDGFGRTLVSYLLGLPILAGWSSLFLKTSSVTSFVMESYDDRYAVPRMIAMSDTTHIRLAGLEDNYRGLWINSADRWKRLN